MNQKVWENLHEDELLEKMTNVLSTNPEALEKLAAEILETDVVYDGDGFYSVLKSTDGMNHV